MAIGGMKARLLVKHMDDNRDNEPSSESYFDSNFSAKVESLDKYFVDFLLILYKHLAIVFDCAYT